MQAKKGISAWLTFLLAASLLPGCTSSAATPSASPSAVPSIIPTATPEIPIGEWKHSGNVADMETDSHCEPGRKTGLIVGINQQTCEYGAGSASISFHVPGGRGDQLITVELSCEDDTACLQIPEGYKGKPARVTLSGMSSGPLWEMRCDSVNGCGPASANPLNLSFVAAGSSSQFLSVMVENGVTWRLGEAKVTAQPLPDLVRGIAYSPYRDCQIPGEDEPLEADIRKDMEIIQTMGNAVRTYSSTGISAKVATMASQMGLRVSAGAWLDDDLEENEAELEGIIELAHTLKLESVIVGNEVMLRGDLTEEQLLGYIERVKAEVDVPVTTADIGGILLQHPRLMEAVDYQLVHIYAYWDGISIENAARYVAKTYHDIQQQAGGKRVVIGETGWPSAGPTRGEAVAGLENQRRFAREFIYVAEREGIEYFYFDAFDEQWKTEGGVGPYWGLLYSDRTFKYDIQSLFVPASNAEPQPVTDLPAPAVGTAIGTAVGTAVGTQEASQSSAPPTFSVYTNFADETNHYSPDGWMGDIERIRMNTCFSAAEKWRETAIEAVYTPDAADEKGWAGVFWLYPKNNWGTMPLDDADTQTYDLSRYTELTFRARTESNAQVKFFLGGVTTAEDGTPLPYPSSLEESLYALEADVQDGFVNLTSDWQEFHIDLRGADLSHVIDGFGWAVERMRNPEGLRFYIDDIVFDTNEPPAVIPPIHVYTGGRLWSGFSLGLDTSGRKRDWLTDLNGEMKASYPPGQEWGVVFINVGQATSLGRRSSIDLSPYTRLRFEVRGEPGTEFVTQEVLIGIKDRFQPDDGTEIKYPVYLTDDWQLHEIDTSYFWPASLSEIYMPIEFVFSGPEAQTIYIRNIQYLP